MKLTDRDKGELICLARQKIEDHFSPGNRKKFPGEAIRSTLQIQCGAFVSLYVNGRLRGCIGTFSEHEPLHSTVENMALSAATTDSRFSPVTVDELEKLRIEISVLTPKQLISGPEEIILGKHGIYIQHGMNRGTLLPQVAISQNWNVEQFLGNCAKYKAGLTWNGWKNADLYTYEAIVFNSEDVDPDC